MSDNETVDTPETDKVKNTFDMNKVKNALIGNWFPISIFVFLFAASFLGGDTDIKKFFGGKAQPKAMVFVDIDMIVDRHIEKVSKKFKMTEEEVSAYSEAFSSQLEASLDYFKERDNVIILVKPAVVRGGVDITKDVYTHILSEIGNE
jgi:type-F conjugative transfer system protein TrbI